MINFLCRTAELYRSGPGEPGGAAAAQQHGVDERGAGRGRASPHLDLEGGQLRLPRLPQDLQLRRSDCHLLRPHRHEGRVSR